MIFNLLKFAVVTILLVISATVGYSRQTDTRGFPVQQQSTGSSFISPNSLTNTPNIYTPRTSINYNNNYKTHGHGDYYKNNNYKNYNVSPNYYYYNPGISPFFYYYYPGGDSYYYNSALPDNNSTINTNDNQSNVETTLPSYDSSSLPDGTWIIERDGDVPDKAFIFQIINGSPTYYCRVQYQYTTYFGVLSPNVGCYIQDDSTIIKFSQYDVLISPN